MRVLVTGNLGYIGTAMVPMMRAHGFDVVGLDCDLYRRCTFGEGLVEVPTIFKDVRDVEVEDLRGFDAVCHLAGLSNDPLGNLNPELTYDINYRASVRLAEVAKAAGVERFVFSSSCSNYGAAGDKILTEESAFNPVTPYGQSKVLTEREVSKMADESFSPTFLRNATAYGLSPRIRFDLVLNNLVAWAFTTGKIMMKSDGTPWRPIVHIEDIARAFIAVLDAPRYQIHDEAFNVGITQENHRIKDLAGVVGELMPYCQISFAEGAGPDKRCYRVNCDKIAKTLNYEPQWSAAKGARQLYDAYRQYGLSLEEFEGPTYQRVAHIRKLMEEGVLDEDLRYAVPVAAQA
jgi:nucleoside-diphosphate-sugar epimerase